MKKKSGSRTANMFSRIINIRAWSDWDRTKSNTNFLVNGFRKLFVIDEKEPTESFEEAMVRLNISKDDLKVKEKALFRLTIIMLAMAAGVLIYLFYQLIYGSYKAAIVSFVVMLLSLILAYRYHFWYFQIKNKKLGCTFMEWYKQGLMGEKE